MTSWLKHREFVNQATENPRRDGRWFATKSKTYWIQKWPAPPYHHGPHPSYWLRFCIDYRWLNAITKKYTYPLPRIDDTLDQLHGVVIFSSLDLAASFWQVRLTDSTKKTTFICREGLFQFNTMPMDLCNATHTFQRLMDMVLGRLPWKCALVYINNVKIYSRGFEAHVNNLCNIFARIRAAGLKLKCIGLSKLVYLGYVASAVGLRPNP